MEKSLREDVLNRAASLLGILSGKTLLFKNEDETGTLMDFALHDILADGKRNTIEIYRDEVGWENELEREILDALIASRTSLFRIFAVAHDEHTLYLHDLLSKAGPPSPENNIGSLIGRKLVDVNLSQTASPGLLMFTRLVPIREDLNMTSGAGFLFPGELQEFLKKRHQVIARKFKDGNEAARRYVAFYRLNKTYGLESKFV